TITAKALTISVGTPSTVVSKVYNGNRTATVNVGALAGLVSGEALGATGVVGTFADKNIGTKNVTAVYTLTDGVNPLHLASNYTLAGETLTGTITAKDLSVFSAAVNESLRRIGQCGGDGSGAGGQLDGGQRREVYRDGDSHAEWWHQRNVCQQERGHGQGGDDSDDIGRGRCG
ncbi:MAG: hypothetical protein EBQ51_01135, partial [Verrucomicrobia bacterium]|nr:hypothetical protein [Verrucomicrobiota bacterium]